MQITHQIPILSEVDTILSEVDTILSEVYTILSEVDTILSEVDRLVTKKMKYERNIFAHAMQCIPGVFVYVS